MGLEVVPSDGGSRMSTASGSARFEIEALEAQKTKGSAECRSRFEP